MSQTHLTALTKDAAHAAFFGLGSPCLMWECGFLNWIAHRNSLVTQRKPRNTSLSETKAFNTQVMVMREELVQHWQHQVIEQEGSQHTGQVISTKKAEPINYS